MFRDSKEFGIANGCNLLAREARVDQVACRLTTIPGIGPINASQILAQVVETNR